jgi:predicted Rossmann fold nucleotide-binding protein DprA/Smf involved in DNA uptake
VIRPSKIISGGQTGVDRAALDAALAAGIALGGWCPKGRLAEDGPLPEHYPLEQTPRRSYRQRTEWNVRDSDGTLVLYWGELQGGTLATVKLADQYRRPINAHTGAGAVNSTISISAAFCRMV